MVFWRKDGFFPKHHQHVPFALVEENFSKRSREVFLHPVLEIPSAGKKAQRSKALVNVDFFKKKRERERTA